MREDNGKLKFYLLQFPIPHWIKYLEGMDDTMWKK